MKQILAWLRQARKRLSTVILSVGNLVQQLVKQLVRATQHKLLDKALEGLVEVMFRFIWPIILKRLWPILISILIWVGGT